MRSDQERLQDILEAIEKIEKYACKGRWEFEEDELIQIWIIHYLEIIGEAASKINDGFRKNNPEISWPKIIGMRNILIHGYFGIDEEIVWNVVVNDLPELKKSIQLLINEI